MKPSAIYKSMVSSGFLALGCLLGCNVDPLLLDHQKNRMAHSVRVVDADRARNRTDLATVERTEVDFVEAVIANREAYHQSLRDLKEYYAARGYPTKESWAAFELDRATKVQQFRYLMDAEIPSDELRPTQSIAEADALYQDGLALMRKGGHGVQVFYRRKIMLQAADKFNELIRTYPQSDKIDDAAFQLGEIHNHYLDNQEALAVRWYERAFTWDPVTPHPARFQAATVYQYRLSDHDRALELYKKVLSDEAELDASNVRHASRQIELLTRSPRTAQASTP